MIQQPTVTTSWPDSDNHHDDAFKTITTTSEMPGSTGSQTTPHQYTMSCPTSLHVIVVQTPDQSGSRYGGERGQGLVETTAFRQEIGVEAETVKP